MQLWKTRAAKRIAAVLAMSVIYLGGVLVAGAPASAQVSADLTCLGTNDAAFSPGLTFTTQTVDIAAEGSFDTCVSSDPAVTSGTYTADGEGTMSCLSGGHDGEFTITWNTGEYSTIEFTNSLALRPGGEVVVLANGTVIDGKFAGDTYRGTFTLFHLDPLACLTTGVEESTGPTTLVLSSL